MLKQVAEQIVLREFDQHLGRVLWADELNDDGIESPTGIIYLDPPLPVRVIPTPRYKILNATIDGWIDPIWYVEVLRPEHPDLAEFRPTRPYIYGPSIHPRSERRESSPWKEHTEIFLKVGDACCGCGSEIRDEVSLCMRGDCPVRKAWSRVTVTFPGARLHHWYIHPNGLGWAQLATVVDSSAYIGQDAIVADQAQVRDNARIEDYAIVSGRALVEGSAKVLGRAVVHEDAKIIEQAVVEGQAQVSGEALVSDSAVIADSAHVSGHAHVFGAARAEGYAIVRGEAEMSGNSRVGGHAIVEGEARIIDRAHVYGDALIEGEAVIDGDVLVVSGVHGSGIPDEPEPEPARVDDTAFVPGAWEEDEV